MSEVNMTYKQFGEMLEEIYTLRAENKILKKQQDFAKRLDSLEKFCEIVEDSETQMSMFLIEIKTALLNAKSFDEFKAMLKDSYFAIESEVRK